MRRCLERAVRAERQAPEVVPKVPAGQREALVTDDRPRGRKRRLRAGEGGERGGGTMARRARFVRGLSYDLAPQLWVGASPAPRQRARRCSALRGRFRGFGTSGLGFLKLFVVAGSRAFGFRALGRRSKLQL